MITLGRDFLLCFDDLLGEKGLHHHLYSFVLSFMFSLGMWSKISNYFLL